MFWLVWPGKPLFVLNVPAKSISLADDLFANQLDVVRVVNKSRSFGIQRILTEIHSFTALLAVKI